MAGSLCPHVQSDVTKYKNQLPDEYLPAISTAIKARINISGVSLPSVAILAATTENHLLIFSKRKLVRQCVLPFKDISKIAIYRYYKNFTNQEFVIVSSDEGNAAVIDLQNLSVVKSWDNIQEIDVKDDLSCGYPQVTLRYRGDESAHIVTCESNWKNVSTSSTGDADNTENPILQNVSLALEMQMRNSLLNLLQLRKQISLRMSMFNRSSTILRDQLTNRSTNKQTPSFLIRIAGNDPVTGSNAKNNDPVIKHSGLWHGVINSYWIIGTSITNTSDRNLEDIQCILTTKNGNIEYKTYYHDCHHYGGLPKQKNIEKLSNLEKNSSLTIIVVASIPEFSDSDSERGSLLMACSFSDNLQSKKTTQTNLGSVLLKFDELSNIRISIEPTCSDPSQLYQNVLSMISVLNASETAVLSSNCARASAIFARACQQLSLIQISAMQCYYASSSIYGDVIVTIQLATEHRLELEIRAQCQMNVKWFIRSLKSVLGDMIQLKASTGSSAPVFPSQQTIHSLSSLLTMAQYDDDLAVIEETTAAASDSTSIDLIRKEFNRKQLKLLAVNRRGYLKIPYAEYHQWQKEYF